MNKHTNSRLSLLYLLYLLFNMDSYTANLTGLLGLCGALFIAQRQLSGATETKDKTIDGKANDGKTTTKKEKKTVDASEAVHWPFLTVYCLVMGSDWLQVGLPSFVMGAS